MSRKALLAAIAALMLAGSANAAIVVALYSNPPTTAGVPQSTRSGGGTWQIYAVDNSDTDFGISSYNITLSGATAINHRSPNGSATDSHGDPQNWGFTNLRSATNSNPIVASQSLPGTSPYLITGFGQEANNATAKITAIDSGATGVIAGSGASWGNYIDPDGWLTYYAAPLTRGHKWMFIAEGTGSFTSISNVSAVFTVYANTSGASVATPYSVILVPFPEPASLFLVTMALVGSLGLIRRRHC